MIRSSQTLNSTPRIENKGRRGWVDISSNEKGHGLRGPSGPNPYRRQPPPRCLPTCHSCGNFGHIQTHCQYHMSRRPMNVNPPPTKVFTPLRIDMENLISMMKDVSLRVDKLEGASGST
jgi:hypothetical protein